MIQTLPSRTPVYLCTFTTHGYLPLALGMIQAYMTSYKDGVLLDRIEFIPLYNEEPDRILEIAENKGNGIWLFSHYDWSTNQCLAVSERVKQADPGHVTIHGGPSVPRYPGACRSFLEQHPHADIAVKGEGERTAAELVEHILGQDEDGKSWLEGLESLKGISWLQEDGVWCTTPDQDLITNLADIPSPYLTGCFDALVEKDGKRWYAAMLMTNRGCPYSCAYCGWGGATHRKVVLFDLERVKAEIRWIAERKMSLLMITDANLGMFARDVDIAACIAKAKETWGYPEEVILNYNKTNLEHVGRIQKTFIDADINCPFVIAVQTRSETTLAAVTRTGIRSDYYDGFLAIAREENIPLTADLILGLPGSTLDSFKEDIQFYYDRAIRVNAYQARLVMNSPMAEPAFMEKHKIRTNGGGLLISCASYSEKDYGTMVSLYTLFRLFEGHGILRYYLRFLQWDYGVRCTDFLHRLVDGLAGEGEKNYPFLSMLFQRCDQRRLVCNFISQNRPLFFSEILRFTKDAFGLDTSGSDFETAVAVNRAVIPEPGGRYPLQIDIPHDFIVYHRERSEADACSGKRLAACPPGTFEVADPYGLAGRIGFMDRWRHYGPPQEIFFELESALMRSRVSPKWKEPAVRLT